jgi:arylsulfatase A-like enzyme
MADRDETRFAGTIARTIAESTPHWPARRCPPAKAPNVVVVVLDDTGWSDFGCFGSEIATPALDRLAGGGLRFNNFHVTPLCSPTRACLLTGQNHHSVGMRFLAVTDTGFPNSRARVDPHAVTVPQLLRDYSYGTYLAGKWHLAPRAECTPAGPFRNWPLARGFDRFYGFLSGATDQRAPELFRDNSALMPVTDPGYHLSEDLVDRAIDMLRDHVTFRASDPFYLQLSFAATHAPFQAPAEFIDHYRGVYETGWDHTRDARLRRQRELGVVPTHAMLCERDPDVPPWDALSPGEKRLSAETQAAFAGFLEHADSQLARLVDWLHATELMDNTVVIVFSDNGAAGDGGRLGASSVIAPYNNVTLPLEYELDQLGHIGDRNHPAHYATGWAMAGNTPFRLYKQFVDLGGVRSPLIIHWPNGIHDKGAVRNQFSHVIDLAATVVDLALGGAADAAGGRAFHGASMRAALADGAAPDTRDTQYFEMLGHRALWHRGWMAVTRHAPGEDYDSDVWRLYHTSEDFSEANDLSGVHPDILADLKQRWWSEAERFGVLPLDDRPLKVMLETRSPGTDELVTRLVLRPGQSHVNTMTGACGTHRDMTVRARFRGRTPSDQGVLLSSGTGYGGYSLLILDGYLRFEHHLLGERVSVVSARPAPAGDSSVGLRIERMDRRSAMATLLLDDKPDNQVLIPCTAVTLAMYGLDVGTDPGDPVSPTYAERSPFTFPPSVLLDVTMIFDHDDPASGEIADYMETTQ